MTATVFIILLNFNGKNYTVECLESVEKLEAGNLKLEVVVVDNGSDEQLTIDNSQLTKQNLKIIRNEENLGFAGGNNVGIRYALDNGADYVLILNNDTIVDNKLIDELVAVAESGDHIGIVAPKIYFAKGYEFHKDRYNKKEKGMVLWYAGGIIDWNNVLGSHRGVDEVDNGQYETIEETEFSSGCCMLITKNMLTSIGFFDEKYFLYYEDSDLCERVKRKGYTIMYAPAAILWHKNAGSAGGSGSALQDYYITRNRLLFGMRYAPLRAKAALMREALRLLGSGRRWQKQGVADFYLCRFGKGSYKV